MDLETIAAQEQKHFSYTTLVAATRDFHMKHKLGEGGFGPVYKVPELEKLARCETFLCFDIFGWV